MLSNAEITEIAEAVNNEEYTIVDALNELAKAAKGEDVRRALYAVAYVLNKEGHSGSVDVQARAGIENLTTSVNEDIAEIDSYTRTNIASMQTQINNIDTTRRALVIDELWTGTELARTSAVATLSNSITEYDYIMFTVKHGTLIPNAFISVNTINVGDTKIAISDIGGLSTNEGVMTLGFDSNTTVKVVTNISRSQTNRSSVSYAPTTDTGNSSISDHYVKVTGIYGIKTL